MRLSYLAALLAAACGSSHPHTTAPGTGAGWMCSHGHSTDGKTASTCVRPDAPCEPDNGDAKWTWSSCVRQDVAYCFTFRLDAGDAPLSTCTATPGECDADERTAAQPGTFAGGATIVTSCAATR